MHYMFVQGIKDYMMKKNIFLHLKKHCRAGDVQCMKKFIEFSEKNEKV